MSDAPKIVLDRLRAAAPREAHPDADTLTAFAEQALSGAEREDVVRHLSRCGDCREIVALSIPPSVEVAANRETGAEQAPVRPTNRPSRSWFAWPTLRWAALAASVVVVGSVLLLHPGKQTVSTGGTENAVPQAKNQTPAIVGTNAVAPSRSEPSQQLTATPAISEQTAPRKQRAGARDDQFLSAQTPAAAPPASLADNKRADSLQDKDTVSYNAGKLSMRGAATSGIVAGELSEADKGALVKGAATASTEADEVQAAPAVGGLLAKNDAPAAPIEKAKPAAKEETEMKSQYQEAAPQNGRLAVAESEVVARREKTSSKQFKKISIPQWSLAQGRLLRSRDAGNTWQTTLQLDRPVLAFGVFGSDVWAGSESGKLLHSTDGGATWATLQPATSSASLSADIVAIEIRSASEVLLSTSTGEFWTTSDSGKTWDKK